ncbi:ImmA/IrrE family metallo-endopeptidase [Nocardioides sp.]|uniref:ImmA/IrrE family metallo-endopeptidase n=1 Tax=Nocardioides sp. TaxID=35761 RepID=UPI00321A4ED9
MKVEVSTMSGTLVNGLTTGPRAPGNDVPTPRSLSPTMDGAGEWAIAVSAANSKRRQLFTLAHEIGHVVCSMRGLSHDDEEQWCDQFAADLVLDQSPPPRRLAESLSSIISFADDRDMGIASSFIALRKTQGWRGGLLVVKTVDSHLVLANTYGLGGILGQHLRIDDGNCRGGVKARPLAGVGARPTRAALPLKIAASRVVPSVEAVRRDDTVFAYFSPPVAARLRRFAWRQRAAAFERAGLVEPTDTS